MNILETNNFLYTKSIFTFSSYSIVIQNIFIVFLTVGILALPLVFWMYIFVSFFQYGVSRKQFIFGIIAGVFSSLPLVYRDLFFIGGILENIFFHFSLVSSSIFSTYLLFYLSIFFLFVFGIVGMSSYLFQSHKKRFLKLQGISLLGFFVLLVLSIIDLFLLDSLFDKTLQGVSVAFGDMMFVSFGAIVGYYIIISLLEEGSKYISSLGFSGTRDYFEVFQRYICLTACIALGFAFFENILYTFSFISGNGVSGDLLRLVFFRSIFSVILHLISSMLFAMAFWHILKISYSLYRNIIIFLALSFLAIGSHVFFDVSLSFGYIGLIFLYVVAMYFLLSYVTLLPEKDTI